MKKCKTYPRLRLACLFYFIMISLTFIMTSAANADADVLYKRGVSYRKVGEWEKALESWRKAKSELDARNKVDPQIGFDFIEVVTEQKLELHYATATQMYFWGLADQSWVNHKKLVLQEIERVLPLLPERDSKRWRDLVKADDKTALSELRQFWIQRDPVISTEANERLIEHWQRVTYARKKFNKGGSSVYGSDDRGLIYVKYGEPAGGQKVTLGSNTTELMTWAHLADFSNAFSTGSGGANFLNLRSAMEFYLTDPECEVWVYKGLNTAAPLVFLFGPNDGKGSFGLRDGVEDLIPNTAFSKANARKTGGLLPGSLLQLMYYGKLARLDPSFEDRYAELNSAWERADQFVRQAARFGSGGSGYIRNSFSKELKGVRNKYDVSDKFDPVKKFAKPSRSDFEQEINPIDLTAYGARLLDQNDEPQMVVMAFEFERIFRRGQSFKFPNYKFEHELRVRDQSMRVIKEYTTSPIHAFSNTVVYRFPHEADHANYAVSLETFLKDAELDSARLAKPIGVGKVLFDAEPALERDVTKLQVSDLVLGIDPPKALKDVTLPFPIIPSNRFFRLETLQVYLELYHLALNPAGKGKYTLDFRVTRLEIKEDKIKRKEMVTTSFEFDALSPRVQETFAIDISKLKAGDYEMSLEVRDTVSSQKKQRSRRFKILKDPR